MFKVKKKGIGVRVGVDVDSKLVVDGVKVTNLDDRQVDIIVSYLTRHALLDGMVINVVELELLNDKVLHLLYGIERVDNYFKSLMLSMVKDKVIRDCKGNILVGDTLTLDIKQSIVVELCKLKKKRTRRVQSITVTSTDNPFQDKGYIISCDIGKGSKRYGIPKIIYLLLIMLLVNFVVSMGDFDSRSENDVSVYTEFTEYLEAGLVDTVDIEISGQYFDAYIKDKEGNVSKEAITYYSPNYEDFRKDLAEAGVKIKTSFSLKAKLMTFASLSTGLVFLLVLVWLTLYQFDVLGKINSGEDDKLDTQKDKITFDDIAGIDGIKEDIKLTIDSFIEPYKVEAMGGRVARGILLEGAPGTGKTMLAKAIANSIGANFIGLTGGDFNQLFMGSGARKVNKVFNEAKKIEPCVVFIDEIDAIGGKRGSGVNEHKEYSNTLNTLLAKMDGISNKHRVLVIGATNLASSLDPALLRSGRFDKIYTMLGCTTVESRRAIIDKHLSNKSLKVGVDRDTLVDNLTKVFNGLSPADIGGILSEAVTYSFNKGDRGYLDFECIDKTFTRYLTSGVEEVNLGKDKEVVAVHEAGHLLMGLLAGKEALKATIVGSTSGIGGFVLFKDDEDKLKDVASLDRDIAITLGGLAATDVVLGSKYLGASNDLEKVTSMVTDIIYGSGLSDTVCGVRQNLSDRDMDCVDRYIDSMYKKVKETLVNNKEVLIYTSNLLKDKSVLYNVSLDIARGTIKYM